MSLLAAQSRLCGNKMVLNHQSQDLDFVCEWFLIAAKAGAYWPGDLVMPAEAPPLSASLRERF